MKSVYDIYMTDRINKSKMEEASINKTLVDCFSVDKCIKEINEHTSLTVEQFRLANSVLTIIDSSKWDKSKLIAYLDAKGYVYKVPRSFSGVSTKIKTNKVDLTYILFETGKCVIVGLKLHLIQDIEYDVIAPLKQVIVQSQCRIEAGTVAFKYSLSNKVYSFKLGADSFPGYLCDWYNNLASVRKYIEYNAVMFPGATIRVPNHSAVLLIFNSRKCILTGGKGQHNYFLDSMKFLDCIVSELKQILK